MNYQTLAKFIAPLALGLGLVSAPLQAEEAAEDKMSPEQSAKVLELALTNHSKLTSYEFEAELDTPAGKAKLEGGLGAGTLRLHGTDPKGVKKQRIVVGEDFFLSTDEGKTWKTGEEAESEFTLLFYRILTAPVAPDLKVWKNAEFTGTEETVEGETLLHLVKPAKGEEEPAVHYWLCQVPKYEEQLQTLPVFVRKAQMVISADDGDFPVTVTYTKLGEGVDIKAPVAP